MSLVTGSEKTFLVEIEGKRYLQKHRYAHDAVFGAMRKHNMHSTKWLRGSVKWEQVDVSAYPSFAEAKRKLELH